MSESSLEAGNPITHIMRALGEEPLFKAGDNVRISVRYPVGHYRVAIRRVVARVCGITEPRWFAKRHGAGPETDKAVGAMAAMLGAIVKNATERA